MKDRIVNRMRNVTINGDYTGGNKVVNYYYPSKEEKDTDKREKNITIFLSYNWHDGETADRIDKYLSGISGITVKRDVRDIGPWKSIREFMQGIRKQDYAVLIISDLYLRSRNCMFEITEIMKEQEYRDRIFPAVVEHGIYDPLVRVEYIKYWQSECKKLEAAGKGIDLENSAELIAELKRQKRIAASVGEFLELVADMNNPDINDVEVQIERAVSGSF